MIIEKPLPAPPNEIIDYFLEHDTHSIGNGYSPSVMAWNIKVRKFDLEPKHYKEFGLHHKLDKQWEMHCKENDPFWLCCEDGLRFILEGEWTYYPGIESKYKMYTAGRSGGWLVLDEFEGMKMKDFDIKAKIDEAFEWGTQNYGELDEDEAMEENKRRKLSSGIQSVLMVIFDLIPLYKFCKSLDEFDASEEFLYQLGFQRQQWEEEWMKEHKWKK